MSLYFFHDTKALVWGKKRKVKYQNKLKQIHKPYYFYPAEVSKNRNEKKKKKLKQKKFSPR